MRQRSKLQGLWNDSEIQNKVWIALSIGEVWRLVRRATRQFALIHIVSYTWRDNMLDMLIANHTIHNSRACSRLKTTEKTGHFWNVKSLWAFRRSFEQKLIANGKQWFPIRYQSLNDHIVHWPISIVSSWERWTASSTRFITRCNNPVLQIPHNPHPNLEVIKTTSRRVDTSPRLYTVSTPRMCTHQPRLKIPDSLTRSLRAWIVPPG